MSNMTFDSNDSSPCYIKINCFTFLSGRQEIDKTHLIAAGTFALTLVPIVGVANILLLSHLRKKQNVPKRFYRLLQILCTADILVGALALPTFAVTLLLNPSDCSCHLELVAQFMAAMFGGTSARTTVVIAFHQSVHVKKLTINPFMHSKRYKFIIFTLGFSVSFTVAMAVTIASYFDCYRTVVGAFTVLDMAFLGAVIFLYLSAYRSVRKHVATNEIRSSRNTNYDRRFAKKVTRIIAVLVICYGPFIVTNFAESFFTKGEPDKWLKLINIWSYNVVFANSFLNALVFLFNDGVFRRATEQYNNVIVLKVIPVRMGHSLSNNSIGLQRLDVNDLHFGIRSNSSPKI